MFLLGYDYEAKKADLLADEVDRALMIEHRAATQCRACEQVVRAVTRALEDLFFVENACQVDAARDPNAKVPTDEMWADLIGKVVVAVKKVDDWARSFEADGYSVDGIAGMRDALREAKAALNPGDEIGGGMLVLRDEAVAEHAAGKTESFDDGWH